MKAVYRKLFSAAAETYLGIQTARATPVQYVDAALIPYVPAPYQVIFRILAHLRLATDDVFLDVGCGKGRVICCASRYPARKVIGIDLDKELIAQARQNAERTRGVRCPVECIPTRAEAFDYNEVTAAFLYHPFERPVVDHFLARFDQTRRRDWPVRFVYANAVHDDAFAEAGWLSKTDEWPPGTFGAFPYRISFWQASDPA